MHVSTVSSFVKNQLIPIGPGFRIFLLLFFFFFWDQDYWLWPDLNSYKVTQYSAPPEQTQPMLSAERQRWLLSKLPPPNTLLLG